MVRLMEERGLRGHLVANGNRKPRVSIKPPSHSSSLSIYRRGYGNGLLPR